jgi:hypothetical protein
MSWFDVLKLRNRNVFTGERTDPTFYRRKFKEQGTIPKETVIGETRRERDGTEYRTVYPTGKHNTEYSLDLSALEGLEEEDIDAMSYGELKGLLRKIGASVYVSEDSRNRNRKLKDIVKLYLDEQRRR